MKSPLALGSAARLSRRFAEAKLLRRADVERPDREFYIYHERSKARRSKYLQTLLTLAAQEAEAVASLVSVRRVSYYWLVVWKSCCSQHQQGRKHIPKEPVQVQSPNF